MEKNEFDYYRIFYVFSIFPIRRTFFLSWDHHQGCLVAAKSHVGHHTYIHSGWEYRENFDIFYLSAYSWEITWSRNLEKGKGNNVFKNMVLYFLIDEMYFE